MSYLLRLVVPDRPGILGAVATALGEAGVDIVSLDVLERGHGVAVDDVVVDLPARPAARQPDHRRPGGARRDGRVDPPVRRPAGHPPRAGAARVAGAAPREGTSAKLLAAELPRVFHSGWAVVLACGAGVVGRRSPPRTPPRRSRALTLPWMPLHGAAAAAERGRLAARAVAGAWPSR